MPAKSGRMAETNKKQTENKLRHSFIHLSTQAAHADESEKLRQARRTDDRRKLIKASPHNIQKWAIWPDLQTLATKKLKLK